jgi:hypothetical protein
MDGVMQGRGTSKAWLRGPSPSGDNQDPLALLGLLLSSLQPLLGVVHAVRRGVLRYSLQQHVSAAGVGGDIPSRGQAGGIGGGLTQQCLLSREGAGGGGGGQREGRNARSAMDRGWWEATEPWWGRCECGRLCGAGWG